MLAMRGFRTRITKLANNGMQDEIDHDAIELTPFHRWIYERSAMMVRVTGKE
jgi:hypothetical protein